ncbi:nuclear transport factor 2 family protein [Aldersonia kunmingensis]|uniref:nuclear transport factor 2 family protein n=1 Tax=Aldersonia kunmingensis TaxID=408066 RepID=UPI000832D319|nr:nuclear transport factor 2 family protein [Aldersonia kunmingensis]
MSEQCSAATEAAEIVRRLAQAKSRQDVAGAMAIYHPDVVLESPPLGTRSVGEEVKGAIEGWFAFAPDYEVRVDGHGLDGDTLCCWGEISLTPAFTWNGAVPNGNRATVPVFMLFRFRDDRIAYESFHFDVAGVARQCGVDASSLVGAA